MLDTIEIRGNSLTQDKVIRRETGIKIGDVYKASRVREVRDRLQRMGIFSTVGEPQLFYENGRSVLQIAVREGSTNIFNGVAGYNPGNDGESGYLTGTLDLQFGNLLGTGRKMAARWEKKESSRAGIGNSLFRTMVSQLSCTFARWIPAIDTGYALCGKTL